MFFTSTYIYLRVHIAVIVHGLVTSSSHGLVHAVNRHVTRLFSVLDGRTSRRMLCQCFSSLATCAPRLAHASEFLVDTNAWLPDVIDQSDSCKRVAAYHKAAESLRASAAASATTAVDDVSVGAELDDVLCAAVIHQSVFTLVNVSERNLPVFTVQHIWHCRNYFCRTLLNSVVLCT